jgi:hypothetical protein
MRLAADRACVIGDAEQGSDLLMPPGAMDSSLSRPLHATSHSRGRPKKQNGCACSPRLGDDTPLVEDNDRGGATMPTGWSDLIKAKLKAKFLGPMSHRTSASRSLMGSPDG